MQQTKDIYNATKTNTRKETAKQLSETEGKRYTQCPSVQAAFI